MKLKIKSLRLGAGRPIAFIHPSKAKHLNIHPGERIEIIQGSKKIISIVDIARRILKEDELGVSDELLELIDKGIVDVSLALPPSSTRAIAKKINGLELSKEEIFSIITDIVNNSLTEPEIAYFVSGVYHNKMSFKETVYLTEAIYKTGSKINWHTKEIADKHSIGGIAGNRTTPIVVSICASLGIVMPKTSSRAITSAAGTADVVEVFTKVDLKLDKLKEVVKKTNACLAWGGSLGLAPADDKLIRIERILNLDPESQLIASILGKKISAGSKFILIDIPYGEGAKVSKSEAMKLAKKFVKIGKIFGLEIKTVLTNGEQPIGNGVGPVLEAIDVLKVLKRENPPKDLEEKSLFLSSQIIEMMGKAKKGEGYLLAKSVLDSRKALKKFEEIVSAQGSKSFKMSMAKYSHIVLSKNTGVIDSINNRTINNMARILGCPIDQASGIYIFKHKNERVKKGEPILALYSESRKKLEEAIIYMYKNHPIKIK